MIEGGLDGPLRASPMNRIAPAQPALERRFLHALQAGARTRRLPSFFSGRFAV